jgi:hypothetical protein
LFFLLLIYEAIRLDRPVLEEDSICCCVEIFSVQQHSTVRPFKNSCFGVHSRRQPPHTLVYRLYPWMGCCYFVSFALPSRWRFIAFDGSIAARTFMPLSRKERRWRGCWLGKVCPWKKTFFFSCPLSSPWILDTIFTKETTHAAANLCFFFFLSCLCCPDRFKFPPFVMATESLVLRLQHFYYFITINVNLFPVNLKVWTPPGRICDSMTEISWRKKSNCEREMAESAVRRMTKR